MAADVAKIEAWAICLHLLKFACIRIKLSRLIYSCKFLIFMLLSIINMVTKNTFYPTRMDFLKNNKAKSFVAIMICVALASFLLRFAAEQLIRMSISQNEPAASSTLKSIALALDNYAKDHKNSFPESISVLNKSKPPYLDKDYTSFSSYKGYRYACPRLDSGNYSCVATPSICRITGLSIYTIGTGGVMVSERCSKEE